MKTTSEVKSGLDDIARMIRDARQMREQTKARLTQAYNQLNGIPTQYGDLITTIDGYTGADAFESNAQAEKQRLAAEFTELKNALEAELTALGVSV